jgi:hypothetical protein
MPSQRRWTARFCSKKCRGRAYRAKHEERSVILASVPTGTIGAIAELVVAADLLRKGYEVFRAQSPSCSCDLVILKDDKLLRVEVRTGYRLTSGLSWPKKNFRADIFAVVVHSTNAIYYEPDLISIETGAMNGEAAEPTELVGNGA